MKLLKYTLLIAITLFVSCSKDDDDQQSIIDETEGLTLIKSLSNDSHTIDLYTKTSSLTDGYNLIYLQIKDGNGNYISNASVSWTPVMHMEMMNHSCPYSSVNRVAGIVLRTQCFNHRRNAYLRSLYRQNGPCYFLC